MDKLEKLVSLCKGEVSITINEHRSTYDTILEFFDDPRAGRGVSDELIAEMVKRDQVVCVQFYPHTPVGCHRLYHYDIETAIGAALAIAIVEGKAAR